MRPIEFARSYLRPFKRKGNEIVPKYCPYCGGGQRRDEDTFALNIEKETFNCKRETNCGMTGTFRQLCEDFGEEAESSNYQLQATRKQYTKPEVDLGDLTPEAVEYAAQRKISLETLLAWQVGIQGNEYGGAYMFPYYDEHNQLVFVKYRPIGRVKKGQRKGWREAGGKPILWGMNRVKDGLPLVIAEGEFDALALSEAGVQNAVSVPSGAQDMTWVDLCWDWLEDFDSIILFGDNDSGGQEMIRQLIVKLGEHKCLTVDHMGYKDANEILYYEGPETLKQIVDNAKPIPVDGLLDLADVTPIDISSLPRIQSNIKWLDRTIGGFLLGDLSIWTGENGSGKSTLLGQVSLLEALEQSHNVCAYSGELRADWFQNWIHLQAAGSEYIKHYKDKATGQDIAYLAKAIHDKLREWYRGRFFLFDNSLTTEGTQENSIIKVFTYAARRYNCKSFLVDNLMTARFDGISESDFYRRQSTFVGELKNFATTHNVHVHLVAHPKKTKDNISKMDIAGSGDITNRADNVFVVERTTEKPESYGDAIVSILKNRSFGVVNKELGLLFDRRSKRFYAESEPDSRTKQYSWVAQEVKHHQPTFAPWDDEFEKGVQ